MNPLRSRTPVRGRIAALTVVLALTVFATHGADAASAKSAKTPAAVIAAATDTLSLSMDDAIKIALGQGVEMRLANTNIDIAAGQIREALSEAFPKFNGSVDYTRRFDSVYRGISGGAADTVFGPLLSNTPFAAANTWSADITASQVLFSRRVGAGLAAAHAYRRSTEANRDETATDVKLAVQRAYYDAAAAGQLTHIAESGLEQAESHLTQVAAFRREGTRAEYDQIQAQVDAMNAEPPVVAARNAYDLALLDLKRVLGVPLDRPVRLTTPVGIQGDAVPVANLAEVAAPTRAAVVAADADVEARKHLLDVERGARWPELKVTGTLSHQAFPDDILPSSDQFRRSAEATARIDFPLFFNFKTQGAIQRASAEMRQAEARRDQVRQQLDLEVERARQEVQRTLAVVLARRGTATLSARAQHLATVRYSNGLATQLEVSDARHQRMNAEGNEVLALRDYRAALASLEHALGRPVPTTMRTLDELSATLTHDSADATTAELTRKP